MTAEVTVLAVDDHTLLVESLGYVLAARGVTVVRPDLSSVPALRAQALASGADLKTVMDRMGHSQIMTTQKYLHTLPDRCQ